MTAVSSAAGAPLPATSPTANPKAPLGQVDVVEEVAADRTARHRLAEGVEERALAARLGQQRLLDLGRDPHLLLHLALLEGLAIEPGVLDGDGGLGGQRLEGRAGGARQQRAFLAAVQIQHPDALFLGLLIGAIQVPHQAQRRAQHVADTQRHGAHVHVGQVAVEQVGDDLLLPRREHLFGNLAAGLELLARQGQASAAAGDLELQLAAGVGQHDEAALGAGDLERRVHHQGQHLVEHAPRAQGAKPFEQRRDLAQVAHRGGRVPIAGRAAGRLRGVLQQEHHLGAAAAPQANQIGMLERVLGDAFAVDIRPVAAATVAQDEGAVFRGDFRVVA